ncbi:NR LBD domain-containing protein [Caenorhabditis elegans]|uniref:NR LBD domain-containing protein n=1 Tax=Caenorhabditis elegans TaxID=6239 RepID=Q3V5K8_CAEEL|nr:NR LBD domain-containing protein [Caenorhabditis elegans]CCD62265.2 NR LBD domain-containing protein [Caenorhabditis elegans]
MLFLCPVGRFFENLNSSEYIVIKDYVGQDSLPDDLSQYLVNANDFQETVVDPFNDKKLPISKGVYLLRALLSEPHRYLARRDIFYRARIEILTKGVSDSEKVLIQFIMRSHCMMFAGLRKYRMDLTDWSDIRVFMKKEFQSTMSQLERDDIKSITNGEGSKMIF